MAKKQNKSWLSDVIRAFDTLSGGIPTDAEKEAAVSRINDLVRTLEEIKARIVDLPGDAQRKRIEEAISTLGNFAQAARTNPAIAATLGEKVKRSGGSAARGHVDHSAWVDEKAKTLESLESAKIVEELRRGREWTLARLQLLAKRLGLEPSGGASRDALIHRIVSLGYDNRRTYDALRSAKQAAGE